MANRPVPPDDDSYIRRLDPDYLEMVADVREVKDRLSELDRSSHRQERYLVGGWDESGTTWVVGLREELREVKKTVKWFWAIATGVWAIFLILLARIVTDFFHFALR